MVAGLKHTNLEDFSSSSSSTSETQKGLFLQKK